jgi:hypothetical protein
MIESRMWLSANPVRLQTNETTCGCVFHPFVLTANPCGWAETRAFIIQDLIYAQGHTKLAYAKGVGAAPINEPRGNLTGDPYFTDGLRAVLWVWK